MPNLSDKYGKTLLLDKLTSYCPGCGHGVVTRLVAEAIEKLGIRERTISIVGIGCGGFSHHYMDVDAIEATHGRSPSFAIGYKLARPDNIVFTYCGDGDSCAIGLGDLMHAANKGLPITSFMINNTVFGMTGGQMSPTSLPNMKTTSSPKGRDVEKNGHPFDVTKTLSSFDIAYLARGSVDSPAQVIKTGKMIKKALQKQMNGEGFCLVEVLSPCPTNWNKQPADALEFMKEQQEAFYPLGEFVDKGGEA